MTGVALATRLDLSQCGLFTPSLTVGALLGGVRSARIAQLRLRPWRPYATPRHSCNNADRLGPAIREDVA
jgi:hypothetical protein